MSLTGWDADKKLTLTIDADDIDSALTDFPVLVNLGTSVGKGSYDASAVFDELTSDANRKKIAIEIGDTGTQCYCEIERWDDANETAQLWVKVPSISSSADTVLNLYYDSTQSDNTTYIGDTGDTPAQSVWDSNFVAVYHMGQDPSGTAPQLLDSTGSGLDMTSAGSMTSGDLIDGLTGKAIDFDGSDDTAVTSGNHGITGSTKTIEATIKTTTTTSYGRILEGSAGSWPSIYMGSSGSGLHLGAAGYYSRYTTTLNDGAFHNVAGVYLDSVQANALFYSDGVVQTRVQLAAGTVGTTDGTFRLGDRAGSDRPYNGIIDEIRISDIARSDDWLATTNLSNTDALVTFALPGVPATVIVVSLLEQPYAMTALLQKILEQPYNLLAGAIIKLLVQEYSLTDKMVQTLVQLYGLKMVVMLVQRYGDATVVSRLLEQWYGDAAQLTALLEQPYEDAYQLRGVLEQPYILPEALINILEQKYSINDTELISILQQDYNLSAYNMLKTVLIQPFSMLDDGNTIITHPATDGVIIAPQTGP